jgi:hypothetical protein
MSIRVGALLVVAGLTIALVFGSLVVVFGAFLSVCGAIVGAIGMESALGAQDGATDFSSDSVDSERANIAV